MRPFRVRGKDKGARTSCANILKTPNRPCKICIHTFKVGWRVKTVYLPRGQNHSDTVLRPFTYLGSIWHLRLKHQYNERQNAYWGLTIWRYTTKQFLDSLLNRKGSFYGWRTNQSHCTRVHSSLVIMALMVGPIICDYNKQYPHLYFENIKIMYNRRTLYLVT